MDGLADRSVRRMGRSRLAAPLALLPLAACSEVMDPAGPIGSSEKLILIDSLAIMLCIVVPTILVTIAFAWWFRASNVKATYRPDFAYSGRIEVVVWAIPMLVILFLGGITWISSHELDPYHPIESAAQASAPAAKPIDVQVVSLDWKWLFIYPDQGVATVNRLVIPAGVPIHFHITSASVMNAFFVPRLGSMIYSMNGMSTQLFLRADQPGRYMGLSSHYSGDGFSDMHFVVDAVPAGQFAGWAAAAKGKGPVLDQAGYAQLSKQSQNVTPFSYGAIAPNLFDAIVMQKISPAAGPPPSDPQRQNKPV